MRKLNMYMYICIHMCMSLLTQGCLTLYTVVCLPTTDGWKHFVLILFGFLWSEAGATVFLRPWWNNYQPASYTTCLQHALA